MAVHNELGNAGESFAKQYLIRNGYEILATNWTFRKAEIDIIALKAGILVAVEVKTRSTTGFGLPQDFVNKSKIRLLTAAVDEYATRNKLDHEIRFDIIAVLHKNGNFELDHIEDAFFHF